VDQRARVRPGVAALVFSVAVLAPCCARLATTASSSVGSTASPASVEPSSANPEQPIPVPDGTRVLAVLDPEAVRPAASSEQAVELARAMFSRGVGESPSVQLATVAFQDGGSVFTQVWTGWIVLSRDLQDYAGCGPVPGPVPCVPELTTIPHTWVWVTVDGEVLLMSQGGGLGSTETPLPMPDADLISIVRDPALVMPATSYDEATAIARDHASGMVDASPMVQFVSTISTRPESPLGRFTGWVVLSTDVQSNSWSSTADPSEEGYAMYSWVFVSHGGEVVLAIQRSYPAPESAPTLPE
jgi:hypothetical protein